VASIIAQGGGDEAEDVLGGLSCTLNNLSWRPDGTHVGYGLFVFEYGFD
jgi:hypothetical protein